MDLYKIDKGKLQSIDSKSFKLEKDIQNIIENNCQDVFGLQFVKSEFTIQKYRLDSLCFDEENKSFVVIEYKKGNSYSVIDQGFTYLSQMLNNKSDFVLEYNESTNSNLKRDDVDWASSRIIFISPSFNSFQKDSTNFRDVPFELWEIKKFDKDIISLNQVLSNSKESIKGTKNIKKIDNNILDEIKVYDEDSIIDNSSDLIKEIYGSLKDKISHWEDIIFRPARRYITINKGKKVLLYLNFQKNRIKIHIVRRVNFQGDVKKMPVVFQIDDPKNMFELQSDLRRERYAYYLEDDKNIDYLVSLIKQKYDSLNN